MAAVVEPRWGGVARLGGGMLLGRRTPERSSRPEQVAGDVTARAVERFSPALRDDF